MTTTIADRVAAGVAWLDEHDPGWWRTDAPADPTLTRDALPIDLRRLNLASSCDCVLGYRWGNYAVAVLDGRLAGLSPADLGFRARSFIPDDWRGEYADLTAEWRRVIRDRRQAVTVDA